jgi:hypothetical protein
VNRARSLALVLVLAAAGPAGSRADDVPAGSDGGDASGGALSRQPHAAYFEMLGKNGLYGLGYDFALSDRFAVGGALAYFTVESEHVFSVSPYANAYPLAGRWGALVLQGGAQLVHVWVPSRVIGWSGTSTTGVAGQISAGYEYRNRFLFRFLASGVFGQGGLRPWVGLALGAAF